MHQTHHDSSANLSFSLSLSVCVSVANNKRSAQLFLNFSTHKNGTEPAIHVNKIKRNETLNTLRSLGPYQWWQNISLFDELWPSLSASASAAPMGRRQRQRQKRMLCNLIYSIEQNMVWSAHLFFPLTSISVMVSDKKVHTQKNKFTIAYCEWPQYFKALHHYRHLISL